MNHIPICIYVIARDGLRGPTCAVHSTGCRAFLLGCLLVGLRLAQTDRSRQPMHVMVAMTTAQGRPRADLDGDIDGKGRHRDLPRIGLLDRMRKQ
ncbi:hypothetical protein HBI24_211940 [Parastagonospora nodorum]|nr:hypothetical protein HBI24_211940 [Parastagonospora nodorum]